MIQESTERGSRILDVHDLNQLAKTTIVRGITRQVGTTSLVTNLALVLAERGVKVLLLDLCLWNCDLTLSFGHTSDSAIVDLANTFDMSGNLSLDLIASRTRFCKSNLDLLPGFEHWLASPTLRAENGWNFTMALLVSSKERWDIVIADLGTHSSSTNSLESTFQTSCAVHAALLQTAHSIVNVCDSMDYLRLWQETDGKSATNQEQMIYVVNRHERELPLGLDQFKLGKVMRAQSFFIPLLEDGLLGNANQLLFVERFPSSTHATRAERQTLQAIHTIASRVHR